ncbi:MAG TPA: penicillin-binding protein 2 [Amycolatopsis sp.]|nr:penicillin-binding protein 2 [Amycolatopsis sp.]
MAGRPRIATGKGRYVGVRVALVGVLVVAVLKLVEVQGFQAAALSAKAQDQRTTVITLPAQRGAIEDRNGVKLAFSVETRALSVNLRLMRQSWTQFAQQNPTKGQNFDTRAAAAAKFIAAKLPGKVTEQELLADFHKNQDFTYLVKDVEPSVADEITKQFPEIGAEVQAAREYPGGTLASNVIGLANWRTDDPDVSKHALHGIDGLELSYDSELAGTPGQEIADTAEGDNSVVIPGTERDVQPAIPGNNVVLTLDSDVQYMLQNELADYVAQSHAKDGQAVVMDAKTGQIYALADDKTFNPNDPSTYTAALMNDMAVSTPYEPGSVFKIVTATAAINSGMVTPTSVVQVPGSIQIADRTVHDAWVHGTQNYSVTGIFAKSSNVGTLELAQRLGPDQYMAMLQKFGVGQATGLNLPGESRGYVPARDQWSASTFGNLPIGQGLSMTVVQMAGMYQAIANNGLRVAPSIIKDQVKPDGTVIPAPPPQTVRVVSPQTAETVRNMLRAVTQKGKTTGNSGTAPSAALEGYQISGKTGTAQQVNPATGAYSDSLYNITFAGILPADNPRFVVGIRLDSPDTTLPVVGDSAGPLFHEIASYLAQRYQIPLSNGPSPYVQLVMP